MSSLSNEGQTRLVRQMCCVRHAACGVTQITKKDQAALVVKGNKQPIDRTRIMNERPIMPCQCIVLVIPTNLERLPACLRPLVNAYQVQVDTSQ